LVRSINTSTTPLPAKVKDPIYNTPEFMAWRAMVVERAGHRCEAVDAFGLRCTKAQPEHRLYAHHIRELRDGGSLLDPNNGECVCASHHELRTHAARARRLKG
jgi:hypothetical protein